VAITMLPTATLEMVLRVMSRAIGTLQVAYIMVQEADISMGMGVSILTSILRTRRMEDKLLRLAGLIFVQPLGSTEVTPSATHILSCIVILHIELMLPIFCCRSCH
jgi:hypothetical protein